MSDIVRVQNQYDIAQRGDDAFIDQLDTHGVAFAWLLCRSPNILLIPGTSPIDHLRENLHAADVKLSDATMTCLNALG